MANLYTSIKSAKVFRNGAEVTRTGKCELNEGKQTLYVYGLSNTVVYDTVRLFGQEGLMCGNLRFEVPKEGDYENEEVNEFQRQIDDLNKNIEVKQLQITLWQTNGDFTSRTAANTEEINDYIEKLPQRLKALNDEIFDCQKKCQELTRKLDEAKEKKGQPLIVVQVEAPETREYSFELRYHENSANWTETYEIHSDGQSDLNIRMKAHIFQWTYEDWKDVDLCLYSADPANSSVLPELHPIILDIKEPVKIRQHNAMNLMASQAVGRAAYKTEEVLDYAEEEAPVVRMATQEAEVSNSETMTEYILSGKKDVYRNGEGTAVDLQNFSIKAEYAIAAAGRVDPNAYLIARIKTSDLPLSDSVNAGIYLNEVFTGMIDLDPDQTKEDLEITLGREEQVHVSFKTVSRKTSSVLLKAQKVTEYVYETKVTNASDKDIEIILRDQVPVSANKDIIVDVLDLSNAVYDKESGLLDKKLTVKANESETFRLSYKVSWPKDKQIAETRDNRKICPSCGTTNHGSKFCINCGTPLY